MTQEFYTLLTDIGLAKEVASHEQGGVALDLTELAIGDGNGEIYNPNGSETTLENEVYRTTINKIYVDSTNTTQVIIEAIIPMDTESFHIREVGIFDSEGDLFAIGKYPETYKPIIEDGVGKDLYIRMVLQFSNTPNVELIIDSNVVMCSETKATQLVAEAFTPLQTQINSIQENYALKDLSNVSKASITGKGIATTDLDNLTANANATTTKKGVVELATLTESRDGTDTTRAITPSSLSTIMNEKLSELGNYNIETGSASSPGTVLTLTADFSGTVNIMGKVSFSGAYYGAKDLYLKVDGIQVDHCYGSNAYGDGASSGWNATIMHQIELEGSHTITMEMTGKAMTGQGHKLITF